MTTKDTHTTKTTVKETHTKETKPETKPAPKE